MRNFVQRTVAVLGAALLAGTGLAACSDEVPQAAGGGITITDVEGRTVTLDAKPERVILGESRGLFATSILNKEHMGEHVVAMGSDIQDNVADYWKHLKEADPSLYEIPVLGSMKKSDVTVENLLSYDPDVIVLTTSEYKSAEKTGFLTQLDNSGLKYVVTDFRDKPLENTTTSMEIFGQVFDREDEAHKFNDYYQGVLSDVEKRVVGIKDLKRPDTFVWRAGGLSDCCGTWNDSNISQMVNFAGGHNIGDELIDGESGNLTPEKVIEADPEHIVITGGDWRAKKNKDGSVATFALVGYDVDEKTAEESLSSVLKNQAGFELLRAPREGNLHSIWHQFYNSPLNCVAVLQLAKWLHPEAFEDVDIEKAWADAHAKWQPVDPDGTFFATMQPR